MASRRFAEGSPVEAPGQYPWWSAVGATLLALITSPGALFDDVREPVAHGRILQLIASVRRAFFG